MKNIIYYILNSLALLVPAGVRLILYVGKRYPQGSIRTRIKEKES